MLDTTLQTILLLATTIFLSYIVLMVREKKLDLRYILVWLSTAVCLILITLIPGLMRAISSMLHIIEPVNTLFLIMIFFMLMIVFSLTKAVSKADARIRRLTQEMAFLKQKMEEEKDQE